MGKSNSVFAGLFRSVLFVGLFFVQTALAVYPPFDRGPDPADPMQRELVKILQELPFVPGISESLQVLTPDYRRGQKMRPDFGAMPIRGPLLPNTVSVLVIGQDATHIAEAANRPGIAGFGGRVQDMLKHFGVFEGVIFTNLYVNTISGQYGSRNTPVIQTDANGKNPRLTYRNVLENRQWLMTHEGPYKEWRNRFIGWIIRNNSKSLKMVMMLGQAGKDAGASFITSIGGEVGAQVSDNLAASLQVPQFKMVPAGGNNEWAVPIDENGRDVAEVILGKKLDYSKPADQKLAQQTLEKNLDRAMKMMVFSKGGPMRNGVLTPYQFGGYDLDKMKVGGKNTRSIKGLRIPDGQGGFVEAPDIVFVASPHPTFLSNAEKENPGSAAPLVERQLIEPLRAEQKRGWKPPVPEKGQVSIFLDSPNQKYKYGRAIIPVSHGDPGITGLRLLPVSDAGREQSQVIVLGTRDRDADFGEGVLRRMEKEESHYELPERGRVLTGRPQFDDWLFLYDRGPSDEFAKLLFGGKDLDETKIFKTKPGKSWKNDGIDAFNVKSHPNAGPFGHYRGTFENPEVLILADPHGYDSIITSKALTGARGQYLHGLMEDIGVPLQYLVLSTVPFGMDGATDEEWETVLEQTSAYREKLINKILQENRPKLILTDGPHAAKEIERILGRTRIPVVKIARGETPDSGLAAAGEKIAKIEGFQVRRLQGHRSDIPREHLTWIARVWEGTSGDRVVTATNKKHRGLAFAIVAPDWAVQHGQVSFAGGTGQAVQNLIRRLEEAGEPLPNEDLASFKKRRAGFTTRWETEGRRSERGSQQPRRTRPAANQ